MKYLIPILLFLVGCDTGSSSSSSLSSLPPCDSTKWNIIPKDSIKWTTIKKDSIKWHTIRKDSIKWHTIRQDSIKWHTIRQDSIKWVFTPLYTDTVLKKYLRDTNQVQVKFIIEYK